MTASVGAVAGKLDAKPNLFAKKTRNYAKKLHDAKVIYALYGALDGLSISYSTFKYSFDLLCTENSLSSSDVMHDWMVTPEGVVAVAVESVFLIGFSLLANIFSDESKCAFKKYVALLWPYCRDGMKGLKNAYKGIRSTLQAAAMLSGENLRYLILPLGLSLGVLSVINRVCMRSCVYEPRKAKMKANNKLWQDVQNLEPKLHIRSEFPEHYTKYKNSYLLVERQLYYITFEGELEIVFLNDVEKFLASVKTLNPKNSETLFLFTEQIAEHITANGGHKPSIINNEANRTILEAKIERMPAKISRWAFLGAAYGGVVDGLYLYMGAIGLAVVAHPLFIMVTAFCAIFSGLCIATRVYEEYDFGRRLRETQASVEFALAGKKLEELFDQLQLISKTAAASSHQEPERDLIDDSLKEEHMSTFALAMKDFDTKRDYLRQQRRLSYTSAALGGLKNGLAAYSAIASVMFAVATINVMISVPFPPAFLLSCVIAGMACLIGFLAYALIKNRTHLPVKSAEENESYNKIYSLLKKMKNNQKEVIRLKPEEVKSTIFDGMKVDPSPQFFFQEWFEVVRSFFSGVSKGQKSVDYTLNSMQESDSQGHYRDTPVMFIVTIFNSIIYAVVLALRALARGFGREETPKAMPVGNDTVSSDGGMSDINTPTDESEPSSPIKDSSSELDLTVLDEHFQALQTPVLIPVQALQTPVLIPECEEEVKEVFEGPVNQELRDEVPPKGSSRFRLFSTNTIPQCPAFQSFPDKSRSDSAPPSITNLYPCTAGDLRQGHYTF